MFNKANELQEEMCAKKLDWRLAQLRLAALRAQVQLPQLFLLFIRSCVSVTSFNFSAIFSLSVVVTHQRDLYGSKAEAMGEQLGSSAPPSSQHRGSRISLSGSQPSGASSGSGSGGGGSGMKSKWMKAIRTLTSGGGGSNSSNGTSSGLSAATACISANSPSGTSMNSLMDAGTNRPSSPGNTCAPSARDMEKYGGGGVKTKTGPFYFFFHCHQDDFSWISFSFKNLRETIFIFRLGFSSSSSSSSLTLDERFELTMPFFPSKIYMLHLYFMLLFFLFSIFVFF